MQFGLKIHPCPPPILKLKHNPKDERATQQRNAISGGPVGSPGFPTIALAVQGMHYWFGPRNSFLEVFPGLRVPCRPPLSPFPVPPVLQFSKSSPTQGAIPSCTPLNASDTTLWCQLTVRGCFGDRYSPSMEWMLQICILFISHTQAPRIVRLSANPPCTQTPRLTILENDMSLTE